MEGNGQNQLNSLAFFSSLRVHFDSVLPELIAKSRIFSPTIWRIFFAYFDFFSYRA